MNNPNTERTIGEQIAEKQLQHDALSIMHQVSFFREFLAGSDPVRDEEGGMRKIIQMPDGNFLAVYMKAAHGQVCTFHMSIFMTERDAKSWLNAVANINVIIKISTDLSPEDKELTF